MKNKYQQGYISCKINAAEKAGKGIFCIHKCLLSNYVFVKIKYFTSIIKNHREQERN